MLGWRFDEFPVSRLGIPIAVEAIVVTGFSPMTSYRNAKRPNFLGLPTMTVNRWVRARKLDSKKRNGYVVLRVCDVLAVGQETGCRLRMGGKLLVIGSGKPR